MRNIICYGLALGIVALLRQIAERNWHLYQLLGCYAACYLLLAVYLLSTLFYVLVFNLIYSRILNLQHYRITNDPWPWQNNPNWAVLNVRTWIVVIFNDLILGPVLLYIGRDMNQFRTDLESFPSLFEVFWGMLFMGVVENILFYCFHRLFHQDWLYRFHKLHHEYKVTCIMASHYMHPVDMLFSGFLPSMAGAVLLRDKLHIFTYLLFTLFMSCQTLEVHSGYEFPWSPLYSFPLGSGSQFHNFHHSHNVGNFGSTIRVMDSLLSTSKDYFSHKKVLKSKTNS